MRRFADIGDGDDCPQDGAHGRMWFTTQKRQWCPSARHEGRAFYQHDGTTPVAPTPARELLASSRVDAGAPGAGLTGG